jgi:hypothetical protein
MTRRIGREAEATGAILGTGGLEAAERFLLTVCEGAEKAHTDTIRRKNTRLIARYYLRTGDVDRNWLNGCSKIWIWLLWRWNKRISVLLGGHIITLSLKEKKRPSIFMRASLESWV